MFEQYAIPIKLSWRSKHIKYGWCHLENHILKFFRYIRKDILCHTNNFFILGMMKKHIVFACRFRKCWALNSYATIFCKKAAKNQIAFFWYFIICCDKMKSWSWNLSALTPFYSSIIIRIKIRKNLNNKTLLTSCFKVGRHDLIIKGLLIELRNHFLLCDLSIAFWLKHSS